MDTTAVTEEPELDALQSQYQSLVEEWIASIRAEAALAAHPHSVAEVDSWEAALFAQDELRAKVIAAKEAYEDGLREKFYQF